ncbi:hypothetical protein LIER_09897 [Lithospermum erythrorhizon]|uniref:Uncharacterized protein n=1 Tax=Lithospermum erythrorhizon TaxID=34254 RepID=A0AAV3PHH4_LITER
MVSGSMHNHGLAHADNHGTTSRIDGKKCGNLDTFWTICPYCYYLYEFLKMYEDCVFKCQNVDCRKVFHGVPLVVVPPDEVVEKGKYFCPGFGLLSCEVGDVWNPFGVLGSFPSGKKPKMFEKNVVEISDDEEMEDFGDMGNVKKLFEKNVKGVEDCFGVGVEEKDVMGDMGKVFIVGDVDKEEGVSGKKVYRTRIKRSVSSTSRKCMGKGVRVKRNEVFPIQGVEEGGRKEGGVNLGCDGGNMSKGTEAGGLEFNIRDDDIFVGLPDIVVGTV